MTIDLVTCSFSSLSGDNIHLDILRENGHKVDRAIKGFKVQGKSYLTIYNPLDVCKLNFWFDLVWSQVECNVWINLIWTF